MKFVVLRDFHKAKNRLTFNKFRGTVGVLVEVTQDFIPNTEELLILDTTNSFQVRPKAIYVGPKGYYYKAENNRVYLSDEQVKTLKSFIDNVDLLEVAE